MYSYGTPHMAGQKQDDQLGHTYSSYVRIRDVALKTSQRRWTIGRGGERGSGISVQAVRHDDDDDDDDVWCFKMIWALSVFSQEEINFIEHNTRYRRLILLRRFTLTSVGTNQVAYTLIIKVIINLRLKIFRQICQGVQMFRRMKTIWCWVQQVIS